MNEAVKADQLNSATPDLERSLNPCIEASWVNAEHFAENTDGMLQTMRIDERVPHFTSLAKYAVAFFWDVTFLHDQSQFLFRPTNLSFLVRLPLRLRELGHPCVERFGADAEPFGHVLDRISALGDLRHRVDLELI